ncbi:MAG TPA: DUF6427 family protein [Bacteroidales bacterium]|nr:DUF6427 family protein [Bacteroidales bacterium]
MILRLYKSKQPATIVLIIITGMLAWIRPFFNAGIQRGFPFDSDPMPLYHLLTMVLWHNHYFRVLFAFIFVILTGFLLVRLNTRYIIITERTNLPALFYILLSSSIVGLNRLNPVIFGALFLLLAIDRILESYKQEGLSYRYFEAALLLGVGSLFYANLIFFVFILWVALIMLRPFYWREWVFTILGVIIPYLFLFSFFYLNDVSFSESLQRVTTNILPDHTAFSFKKPYTIFLIYLFFLIVVVSEYMVRHFPTKKIQARKTFMLFFWLFLSTPAIYLLVPSTSIELIYILAIPLSFVLSHYFVFAKSKWLPEALFIILLILIIVNNIYA